MAQGMIINDKTLPKLVGTDAVIVFALTLFLPNPLFPACLHAEALQKEVTLHGTMNAERESYMASRMTRAKVV